MIDLFEENRRGNSIADFIDADGDCCEWTGSKSSGYGRVRVGGRIQQAHRVVFEALIGSIPDGLDLDHLCRNRACVNPDHLEPVTRSVNFQRSYAAKAAVARNRAKSAALQLAQSHCHLGHPYKGENLYVQPSTGYRQCRTCKRASNRRHKARQRAAA